MSIFGSIMAKIFGSGSAAAATPVTSAGPTAAAPAPMTGGAATAAAPARVPISQVDVAAVLTKLASESKQKLDWRHSIVDLMKLLNLDSSLGARKELAQELQYTGDTSDSAAMNIW